MSEAARLAAEEADRVEAEEAETPDDPEDDPQPVDEPVDEPEPELTDAARAKAERIIEQKRDQLAKAVGEHNVAVPCLLCGGPGFVPELPPVGTTFEIVEQDGELGLDFRAPADLGGYEVALDKEQCDECKGKGLVRTGSETPEGALWQCGGCQGNGWKIKARPEPQYNFNPPTTATAATLPPNGNVGIPPDAWGRPWGDPAYGQVPPPAPVVGS